MNNGFEKMQLILKSHAVNGITVAPVNSRDISSNTINSKTVNEEIETLLKDKNVNPDGVAELLSELLDDKKSMSYYFILAKEHHNGRLLEAAHITKDAYLRGSIRTTKPIYFLAILRKWGLRTKFKNQL